MLKKIFSVLIVTLCPLAILAQYTGGAGMGNAVSSLNNVVFGNYFLGVGSAYATASNWSRGVLPSNEAATICSSGIQPIVTGNQTVAAGTILTIQSGATLTVASNASLAVNGVINNLGTLYLASSSTTSASIANSSGTINGNVTIDKFVPAVARRWRCYAPPITDFTYTQLIDDIFISGPLGGVGFDSTSKINNPSVYTYNEDVVSGRGWQAVNNINSPLANGTGAIVFIRGDRTLPSPNWYTAPYVAQNAVTLDVTGTIKMGTYTKSLSYTNTGDTANDGWNLVGNPYPSAINWSALTKNNLSPFYYILNPNTDSYTVLSSGTIESGQSFFVQAIGNAPSITFNESNKTTSSSVGYFNTIQTPFTIKLVKDSITSDLAILKFDSNACKGYKMQEDAFKLSGGNIEVAFISGNYKFHINTVPQTPLHVIDTFELSIDANQGTYQLELTGVSNILNYKNFYLIDTYLNHVLPITSDTSITISITSNVLSLGKRFLIVSSQNTALPISLISFTGNHIDDGGNKLKWITASEHNVDYFLLQRKQQQDPSFVNVTKVPATGNSAVKRYYSYVDELDFTGTVLYRLISIDSDKQQQISNVIAIASNLTDKSDICVLPNPVKRGEPVQLEVPPGFDLSNTSLRVYDITGVTILNERYANGTIETAQLKPGVYFLELISDDKIISQKIVVF